MGKLMHMHPAGHHAHELTHVADLPVGRWGTGSARKRSLLWWPGMTIYSV